MTTVKCLKCEGWVKPGVKCEFCGAAMPGSSPGSRATLADIQEGVRAISSISAALEKVLALAAIEGPGLPPGPGPGPVDGAVEGILRATADSVVRVRSGLTLLLARLRDAPTDATESEFSVRFIAPVRLLIKQVNSIEDLLAAVLPPVPGPDTGKGASG